MKPPDSFVIRFSNCHEYVIGAMLEHGLLMRDILPEVLS
jgi:hypothetical protein